MLCVAHLLQYAWDRFSYSARVGFFSHPDDNDFAHQKRKVASALASSRHTPDYIITFALSFYNISSIVFFYCVIKYKLKQNKCD